MRLYELTDDFRKMFDDFENIQTMEFEPDGKGGFVDGRGDPIDPDQTRKDLEEAWFNTLEVLEEEIDTKAESIAIYIKECLADAGMLEAEEKELRRRRQALERTAERMKTYLGQCMERTHRKKIEMPRAVISVRNNPESVNVTDEKKLIEWAALERDDLLKFRDPEISKSAVRAALKEGQEIPFCELRRTQSVIVK